MAAPGTYEDPALKLCFNSCSACYRCKDKGRFPGRCDTCSGCMDPAGKIDVDPDNFCQCAEGVLRWRTKNNRLIIRKYNSNPFGGRIQQKKETDDERDWERYLQEYREHMENPYVSTVSANMKGKKAYYSGDVGFFDEEGNRVE